MGLMADTLSAMVLGIAAFVGVSALLLWLNDAIWLPGLGSGIWLLMTIPMFSRVPREIMSIETVGSGLMPAVASLGPCRRGRRCRRHRRGAESAAARHPQGWWHGAGHVPERSPLSPVPSRHCHRISDDRYLTLMPASIEAAPLLLTTIRILFMGVLIPLLVYGYFRQLPVDCRADMKPILAITAVAQVVLCTGFVLIRLIVFAPAAPAGPMLLVCVTVLLALGRLLMMQGSLRKRMPHFGRK